MKLGSPRAVGAGQQFRILEFRPDRRIGPLIAGSFDEADRKTMGARLIH